MINQAETQKIIKILKKGGIIAFPTDTLFGLGSDATNQIALEKIFQLKGRDYNKPLSIACSSVKMLREYTNSSLYSDELLDKIFPGPVTLLLNKNEKISDLVTAGSPKIGVRIPDYQPIRDIIKKFGKPIIATSANISGEKDLKNLNQLPFEVDYILNGQCKYKIGSTVFDPDKKIILRSGAGDKLINKVFEIQKL